MAPPGNQAANGENKRQPTATGGPGLLDNVHLSKSAFPHTFDSYQILERVKRRLDPSFIDTGSGMDDKTMKHIFEPFYTSKGLAKGTGLGLASVSGVVKSHGGYVDVQSEKGKGSRFDIYLPSIVDTAQSEKTTRAGISRGREAVLFVDDEECVLEVGEDILTTLGYQVVTAKGGKEAISYYAENHDTIDGVILDMVMLEMSGGQVYDKIKQVNPKAKVLLSSGYTVDGQASEILERGCSGFIQKPFNIAELSHKLRQIFEDTSANSTASPVVV